MPKPRRIPVFNLEAELAKKQPELDNTPLTFGKYEGLTPTQIADSDPSYIIWMWENLKGSKCSDTLYEDCVTELRDEADDYESIPFLW